MEDSHFLKTIARKSISTAVLVGATLPISFNPAYAEANLTVNSLLYDFDRGEYETYGYFAQDIVGSANSMGAAAVRLGHDALDLSNRSAVARLAYAATAFQALYRFQWANSLYFGHEFVHFSTADQIGLGHHYFYDTDAHEEISFSQAYWRAFSQFEVGGPAVSTTHPGEVRGDISQDDIMQSLTAGIDWQMNYSETWLRHHLTYGDKDVFDATDFFLNRTWLMGYALGDHRRSKNDDFSGDVYKFANHIENTTDETAVLTRVATLSILANMMSPSFWTTSATLGTYISQGKTEIYDPFVETGYGGFTYDIPQYLNANSMSVVPTIYWRAKKEHAAKLGADTLVASLGVEAAIVGNDKTEVKATVTGSFGDFDTDLRLAGSASGYITEIDVDYNLTDHFAISAGAAVASGSTLRAKRNFPRGEESIWLGMKLTF